MLTMRSVLLILVAVGVVCGQYVEVSNFDYHSRVGIPEAARIKEAEDSILRHGKIIGGAASSITSHPYMAGLLITFVNIAGISYCGASLLSANRLVTAGHCWADGVNQAAQFEVVLGSDFVYSGGTRIATSHVIPHPQFNPAISAIVNDVAMIYLPSNVAFTASIQPIPLPTTVDLTHQFVAEWGTAVGYGRTSDSDSTSILFVTRNEVNLQVMRLINCQLIFGFNAVLPSNLCTSGAGRVGICFGDSGGPLSVVRNGQRVLVGISSFIATDECASGYPSVFARVTSFYSFLVQHLV